jgi:hypothetical protein
MKGETMKYVLLIQSFGPEAWERFSEDEKTAINGEYKAIADTPVGALQVAGETVAIGTLEGRLNQPRAEPSALRLRAHSEHDEVPVRLPVYPDAPPIEQLASLE